jgi:hypothetical protein
VKDGKTQATSLKHQNAIRVCAKKSLVKIMALEKEKDEKNEQPTEPGEESDFSTKYDQLIADLKKANQKVADLEKSTKIS